MNAETMAILLAKGLSASDLLEVARAMERKADNTNAERQARYRSARKERKAVTRYSNGVIPPIEEDHTPSVLISTEVENEHRTRTAKADPFPKPEWAEDQVWFDFMANRKAKKARNTATAYAGFLSDIARLSDGEWPPGRLLRHAAAKGWAGIYDPREKTNGTNIRNSGANGDGRSTLARVIDAGIANLERAQTGVPQDISSLGSPF